MRIGMIGGGGVGQTLGAALIAKGHEVVIGIRNPSAEELAKPRAQAEPLAEWVAKTGGKVGTFAEAAASGEVVFNVTQGAHSLEALQAAGAANLSGKVLIDVANPLDFSAGMPPFLNPAFTGATSLGEQIQAAFPEAKVVKAFNTVAAAVMVTPGLIPGDHDLFVSGNDGAAKEAVKDIARGFGWTSFADLGDLVGARAQEAVLPVWVRLWMTGGTHLVNLKVVRA
ncbi:NADPH-dependent F420 reductase [Tabrizicola sp.]|uniref:NADPH-dependent F420 reductase n=1 Tax=Tabrizicola sp. TaxID=2005166 RepID=UPI003F35E133